MIVSIKENKFQVAISTLCGFIYYQQTKDEVFSILIVLISAFILRRIGFDSIVQSYLTKKSAKFK